MSENRRKKSELDTMIDNMQGIHSKRMNAILQTCDDEDFPVHYFKLAEFVIPKLQRREIQVESSETKIVIEHVVSNAEDLNKEEEELNGDKV